MAATRLARVCWAGKTLENLWGCDSANMFNTIKSLIQNVPQLLSIPSLNFPRPSVWPKPPIQVAPQVLTRECRLLTNVWSRSTRTHMVRAAPSGLRFRLTVDYRTNDTLSVSAICETYCISTCCETLWLKCNHISFNKSKNMTPSLPIPRSSAPFCLLSKYPYRQITKDFAMRDENYVD